MTNAEAGVDLPVDSAGNGYIARLKKQRWINVLYSERASSCFLFLSYSTD